MTDDDVPAPFVPPVPGTTAPRTTAPGTTAPAVRVGMITFDTRDPAALAQWWAHRTGGRVQQHPGFAMVLPSEPGGVTLGFQEVPDPTPGKNRVHLDLTVEDVPAWVEASVAAGATRVGDHSLPDGFAWTVLADPDGNQFCVSPAHED
ncbi:MULTISPECIES: VOC family protein [Cellulomonas]|uniref:VOC family protein n=1 Tax=Cellulomonas TaxID=1707 RepID=UPI0014562A79|nr:MULTISPECIES: VOC family protein [Cellulomonas]